MFKRGNRTLKGNKRSMCQHTKYNLTWVGLIQVTHWHNTLKSSPLNITLNFLLRFYYSIWERHHSPFITTMSYSEYRSLESTDRLQLRLWLLLDLTCLCQQRLYLLSLCPYFIWVLRNKQRLCQDITLGDRDLDMLLDLDRDLLRLQGLLSWWRCNQWNNEKQESS